MVLLSLTGPVPGVDICRDRKLVGGEIILINVAKGLSLPVLFLLLLGDNFGNGLV